MDIFFTKLSDESWLKIFQSIYTWALIITVLSTIFVNIFASKVTKKMQKEITESNEVAEKSKEIAAESNERAMKLELQAEELKKENIQLGLQLEEEKIARLEIERKLAPRFLTKGEEKLIFSSIQKYAGHPISITKLGEAEASNYGTQIINLVKSAGWNVTENYSGIKSPPPYKVIVFVSANPDDAVQALVTAFQNAGVKMEVKTNPSAPPEKVDILIGLKLSE